MPDFDKLAARLASYGTLSKAPIVEAVIAYNFKSPQGEAASQDLLERAFPHVRWEQDEVSTINVSIGGPGVAPRQEDYKTIRFLGQDQTSGISIICQPAQFAVSMQRPYTEWKSFYQKSETYWQDFQKSFGVKLTYPGLRYINRLDFNRPLAYYLRQPLLEACDEVSLSTTGYMRMAHHIVEDTNYVARVGINFVPQGVSTFAMGDLLMDIDISVRQDGALDAHGTIIASLDEMRLVKNHIFFNSLSDQAIADCR